MAKRKPKKQKDNAYLDQDSKTGSVCEHLMVFDENPVEPLTTVCSCDECPNGGWTYRQYFKNDKDKKPYRTVKSFKCYSELRKKETKIKDTAVISPTCPYRKEDARRVAYEGID